MEIVVNNSKKTTRLSAVENGSVFRYPGLSDYWLATDETEVDFRHCVRLRDGVLDHLARSAEVVVVKAKMEITE